MTGPQGYGYPPGSNPDPGSPQYPGYQVNDPVTGQPFGAAPGYPPADGYPPTAYSAAPPQAYPGTGGFPPYGAGQPGYQIPGQSAQPAGYPVAGQALPGYPPSYPVAPGYGYPPPSSGRPGPAVGAAVLAFVQAAVVLIGGIITFSGSTAVMHDSDYYGDGVGNSVETQFIVVAVLTIVAAGLLIAGGAQLLARKSGLLLVGSLLSLAISVFWLIELSNALTNSAIWVPMLYAVMPIISICLAYGARTKNWLRGRAA